MSEQAVEQALVTIESLILEATIEDHELALNGLMFAYEVALRERYPFKIKRRAE